VSDGAVTTFYIYGTDDGREVTYTTSDFFTKWAGRSQGRGPLATCGVLRGRNWGPVGQAVRGHQDDHLAEWHIDQREVQQLLADDPAEGHRGHRHHQYHDTPVDDDDRGAAAHQPTDHQSPPTDPPPTDPPPGT